ncbi:MAG: tRNA (adenosine(37)-N6)-threonylcarbamoyltransferase complex transferase subunit TsaD [Pseudobdellovibrionaceae bacterium]
MKILGIETSCDETAAAIVNGEGRILAHALYSQLTEHAGFGGVVPEVAARAHVEKITPILESCLAEAGLKPADLDAIAATSGPGLIGGVMVGMVAGKALAAALDKPFIAINHLEAHVLMPRLTDKIEFPYLALLVSGGHTQFLYVKSATEMTALGETIDDALGEAFDKSAKMMGLPYPGGPAIEALAGECPDLEAARSKYPLPRPLYGQKSCDFSFSGLKTAMRTHIENMQEGDIPREEAAALAASFQATCAEIVADRLKHALEKYEDIAGDKARRLALVGGVAANRMLFEALSLTAKEADLDIIAPPPKLCTDNGVMIAWAGMERFRLGLNDPLDFPARPRWSLGTR